MKPDVSRQAQGKRRYRRGARGTCCICTIARAIAGQRRCHRCHALTQAFSRVRRKVAGRTLDDDVKMVRLGVELLHRRLVIGRKA